jgi:transposase
MEQAAIGKIALFFVDASHFVMGCDFLGYIYGITRRFVKTYSGRSRYNVLGAVNFLTKAVTTVTNNTYITATEVCELLKKISEEYGGKAIHLVLDNARYQKCKIVQELAAQLKITLVYIPPYSPNLNLIERLWKFTKSRLRTRYYDEFDVFCKRIDAIIDNTSKGDKQLIDKLIGEKVQLFDELQPVNPNTFIDTKARGYRAA